MLRMRPKNLGSRLSGFSEGGEYMQLAKVVGNVVSTQKDPNLVGCKLLIIKKIDEYGEFEKYSSSSRFASNTGRQIKLTKDSSQPPRSSTRSERT